MEGTDLRPLKTGIYAAGATLLVGAIFLATTAAILTARAGRTLRIGMDAPTFAAKGQDGRTHHLADYQGRPVALVFCPGLDADSVAEFRSIRDNMKHVDAIGMKVFGICPLPSADLKALHDREKLPYPMLSDESGELARSYGLRQPGNALARVTVAIGPNGKVLLPILQVDAAGHGKQLVDLTECCLDKKAKPTSPLLGKPVPNLALARVSDGKLEPALGDGKRPTVLLFLSAECPCSGGYDDRDREMAKTYEQRGVRFIGVYSSACEPTAEVAAHAKKAGFTFPVYRDPGYKLTDALQAQVTPEAFVVDSKGVLRYHGRVDDNRDALQAKTHDLRNALDLLIAGQNPNPPETLAFGCAISRAGER